VLILAVTDEGARALADSPYLTKLRVLDLQHNPLTAGVASLAESPTLANLRELHLQCCDLDDEAARALARSSHLSQLRRLIVRGNRIREAAGQELTRRFGEAARLW
jgi:Ran GTPase-activating protein (RanGAP) involved in mRNA processing and transport